MNYDPTGSYIAIGGLIVAALGQFGVLASADQIGAIIGGLVAIYGIIQQYRSHKQLAQATGILPK